MSLRDQFERIDKALAKVVYPEPKGPEEEPMPLIIKESEQKFEPAPPGLHRAVCVDVVDLGMVDGKYGPKRKVKLIWQLSSKNKLGERFQVRATYTQSLFEGSNLRRDLESWRGRSFTAAELKAFDIEKLLGANCQLSLKHNVSKDGRTYANVTVVLPPDKAQPVLVGEDYAREPWASEKEAQAKTAEKAEHYDVDPIDEGIAAQYDDDPLPF